MELSITDPRTIREIANDPRFASAELYPSEARGHKFKVGEMATLHGLVDFPQYNGQRVKITAIREDGAHGRAYYIEGEINAMLNWTYEYRLA